MCLSDKTTTCNGSIPISILEKVCLKLIMLTEDKSDVIKADLVAQQEPLGVQRCVVWIKDLDQSLLIDQIPELGDAINNCSAFSLSTINKIGWIIDNNTVINYVRLDRAFIKAGKPENN